MSKFLNFIWIDDNPERKSDSVTLSEKLNIACDFIDVKNDSGAISSVLESAQPSLIIIDHNLEDIRSGDFKKGSTVAAYIRETWPECPIVCITGEDIKTMDSQKRSQYEEVIAINKISDYYSAIHSIASSFDTLKESRPHSPDDIIQFLMAPDIEQERLKAILPKELKEDFTNNSVLLDLCHWTRKILLQRPGFLYNQLWIATLLGLSESGFKKVGEIFEPAKYSGVFNDESQPRWWKSKVLSILSETVVDRGLPWEKGRKLAEFEKQDYSKCYASGEDYPETVAYVDQTASASMQPMKLKHTIAHPNFEGMLFFEEIRMMKPAE